MLILERPWTRQPPAGSPPSSEWMARGMVALFDQRIGREIVQGAWATVNTATVAAGIHGMARDYSGSTNTQYAHHPAYAITGAITIAALIDVDARSSYSPIISKEGSSTANVAYELRIGGNSTGGEIDIGRAGVSGIAEARASTSVVSAGYSGPLIMAYPNGTVGQAAKYWLKYTQGALSTLLGGGTGDVTDSGAAVWIGRRQDGATQLDGRIYYVALFNRELSDSEARALRDNPWQIFADRQIPTPAAAAATAPSITALSARLITATSAQPRISYS